MSDVATILLGKRCRFSYEEHTYSKGYGTIVAVYYTGNGLTMLVALDVDRSYRNSPRGHPLKQVHWDHIDEVFDES